MGNMHREKQLNTLVQFAAKKKRLSQALNLINLYFQCC